jgi:hypothetical protein
MIRTCKRGHLFDLWNTRYYNRGNGTRKRSCLACATLRQRERYQRVERPKRAAARAKKAEAWCAEVSDLDLAWASGHFEGEGTVTIHKNHTPSVLLASTDEEVIAFFCARWPATSLQRRLPNKNCKLVYTWRVASAIRVHRFLEQIFPHLRTGRVKTKARLVLSFCEHLLDAQYNRESDKSWKTPLVAEIRRLNRKGPPPPDIVLPSGERVIDRIRADHLLPPPAEAP